MRIYFRIINHRKKCHKKYSITILVPKNTGIIVLLTLKNTVIYVFLTLKNPNKDGFQALLNEAKRAAGSAS
jgi:hypothetical protein